ncbi:MAG TPA: hypothetical protein DDW52_26195 [Planctomycetaceae bacterium]|nr:hypothetical protein [Planctomycetaceae bacterium]
MRQRLLALALVVVASIGIVAYFLRDAYPRSILVDGQQREYFFHQPQTVRQPVPLILMFHGFSGTAAGLRERSGLHELVDEYKTAVAYLDGQPSWHRPSEGRVNPDVRFIEEVIGKYSAAEIIDRNRVYLAGMSMGGDFVIRAASQRSDLIAAVVAQAMVTDQAVPAERAFPMLIIVGTEDDRVSEETLARVPDAFRSQGHEVTVICPEGVGHQWHPPLNRTLIEFLLQHSLD